jgi:hypothetical protein
MGRGDLAPEASLGANRTLPVEAKNLRGSYRPTLHYSGGGNQILVAESKYYKRRGAGEI